MFERWHVVGRGGVRVSVLVAPTFACLVLIARARNVAAFRAGPAPVIARYRTIAEYLNR